MIRFLSVALLIAVSGFAVTGFVAKAQKADELRSSEQAKARSHLGFQNFQGGGSQAQGFQAQGFQAQGSQVQGSQVQGFQVQGSQVQGSQVQGSQVQGSQVQAQGFQAEGSQVQDFPAQGSQAQGSQDFQISVNLNLVVLPVTVRDKKGGFATDLGEKDFEVFEDGVKQSVRLFRHEDTPVTVGLVVDHSGSMQHKMPDVLSAAQTFVSQSNEDDQMFVVNFNERVTIGLPSNIPFTNSPAVMETAIELAPVAGQTALYDALDAALDRLRTGKREKKVLLVISDGGDNASKVTLPQILKKAEESNALVYTVGIFEPNDPDQNPAVLRRLAKESGGEAFFPEFFSQTVSICQDIAKDIRHQYTLGYVSNSTKAAGHRNVRVVARSAGKDLVVRTRAGYTAGETP